MTNFTCFIQITRLTHTQHTMDYSYIEEYYDVAVKFQHLIFKNKDF